MEYLILWIVIIVAAFGYWLSTSPGTIDRRKASHYLIAAILGPIILAFIIIGWLLDDRKS